MNGNPTIGEVYRAVIGVRDEVRDLHATLFIGRESFGERLATLETGHKAIEGRITQVESRPARAGIFAGVGTALGAAIVVVMGALGIRFPGTPPGPPQ